MDVKLIREKIKDGSIKSWPDVYGYCSLKEMAQAFGREARHWKHVKSRPLMITIGDMERIIEVLKITRSKFLELVEGVD